MLVRSGQKRKGGEGIQRGYHKAKPLGTFTIRLQKGDEEVLGVLRQHLLFEQLLSASARQKAAGQIWLAGHLLDHTKLKQDGNSVCVVHFCANMPVSHSVQAFRQQLSATRCEPFFFKGARERLLRVRPPERAKPRHLAISERYGGHRLEFKFLYHCITMPESINLVTISLYLRLKRRMDLVFFIFSI